MLIARKVVDIIKLFEAKRCLQLKKIIYNNYNKIVCTLITFCFVRMCFFTSVTVELGQLHLGKLPCVIKPTSIARKRTLPLKSNKNTGSITGDTWYRALI